MTIYEKNLEALTKNQARGLDKYLEVKEKGEFAKSVLSIEAKESRDGNLVMTVTTEMGKARLNSPYYPQKEAVKWVEQYNFANIETVMVMFGLGNGVFVRTALSKLQKDGIIAVYEPSFQVFDWVMEHIDISDILEDGRVLLHVNEVNRDYFSDGLELVSDWANIRSQIYAHHTGYDALFSEEYVFFLKEIKNNQQMIQINTDTNAYFSEATIPNTLNNLKYLREGHYLTSYIDAIPKGTPAIIVAAGPSLDKNIDLLREAKGKAFIIATDTAVRHLIKHDIMPDVMVTLDAMKPADYISDPVVQKIPMFCVLSCNYRIMDFHQGMKIWFNTGGFLEKIMAQYGKIFPQYNPGGSVATASFAIAVALGMDRIVLVGQDLAYSGNVTHAGGEVSKILNENFGQEMVEGIDGQLVKSRYDWIIYRDWFQDAIRDVKDQIQVIDATEGGAKIQGAEIMTLRQVVDAYCTNTVDIQDILESQPPMFSEGEYEKLRQQIKQYPQDMANLQELAKQAKVSCDKLVKLIRKKADDKQIVRYVKKLREANETMESKDIYMLLDDYAGGKSENSLQDIFQMSDDTDEVSLYQKAGAFYQSLVDAARELYPQFDQIISRDIR